MTSSARGFTIIDDAIIVIDIWNVAEIIDGQRIGGSMIASFGSDDTSAFAHCGDHTIFDSSNIMSAASPGDGLIGGIVRSNRGS